MLTVQVILVVTAFVASILCAMGKCPAWVPCITLSVFGLILVLPK